MKFEYCRSLGDPRVQLEIFENSKFDATLDRLSGSMIPTGSTRGHRPVWGLRRSFFRIRYRNTRLIKSDAAIYCHRTFIGHRSALRPLMISAARGAVHLSDNSPRYSKQAVPVHLKYFVSMFHFFGADKASNWHVDNY
jgi:hypothetical protein